MSRIEYMRKLASLLQDVPVEERVAAMQYYNDFFDDAGEENEESVIEELGAPEKVAAALKAGLDKQTAGMGEYGETGYTHPDLEQKSVPDKYTYVQTGSRQTQNGQGSTGYNQSSGRTQTSGAFDTSGAYKDTEEQRKTSKWILWIILALCAAPIVIPVIAGAAGLAAGLVAAAAGILIALVAASVGVIFGGGAFIIKGVILAMDSLASGMALTGAGIMLLVLGLVAVSASIQLAVFLIPKIIKLILLVIDAIGRAIHRRKAV